MRNYIFIILFFPVLLSTKIYGQSEKTLYLYTFKIYKDGKPFVVSQKNKVKAYIYNYSGNEYKELKDTCVDKNKYCFRFYHEHFMPVLLRLFSGKDTMSVFTSVSMDSLTFKNGVYNYSINYEFLSSIIPARSGISLTPSNAYYKAYPKKGNDFFARENKKIKGFKFSTPEFWNWILPVIRFM